VHVNNLFNTAFWALVHRGGQTKREAEVKLKGTTSADKNKLLFDAYGINYNAEPAIFRKGSVLVRSSDTPGNVEQLHVDIINDEFWDVRPALLSPPDSAPPRLPNLGGK
jgi:tRNA(His) guanylyltransferase